MSQEGVPREGSASLSRGGSFMAIGRTSGRIAAIDDMEAVAHRPSTTDDLNKVNSSVTLVKSSTFGSKGGAAAPVAGCYPIEVSHLSYSVLVDSWVPQQLHGCVPEWMKTHDDAPRVPIQKVSSSSSSDSEEFPIDMPPTPEGTAGVPSHSRRLNRLQSRSISAGKVKKILDDVSFAAQPGQILAVVGSSGAGKSTVLDALAGRIKRSCLDGEILVNGEPAGSSAYKRLIGYVMQDDALFPMLTPRETLMMSACLRLPTTMSKDDKAKKVDRLLTDLGLQKVADSKIGDAENRGISGGERRRVSIGLDLIHDPPVLLLDEPTSGLDSHAAFNVVEVLRKMADEQKKTIVLSIHQPSYKILNLIDKFLLMCRGTATFCGSLPALEARLEAMGQPIPLRMNGLEYAIELLQSQPAKTMELFKQSRKEEDDVAVPVSITVDSKKQDEELEMQPRKHSEFATSTWNEIGILCNRNMKVMLRTKEICLVRAMQVALAALGLGTVFLQIGTSLASIQSRMGFLAFSMAFLLTSSMEALPLFLKERQVFVRETARGAYRLSSYQIASVLVFLPFLLVLAILFSAGSYWLVGLYPSFQAFGFFILTVWGALIAANSMVAFFAALTPDFITANSLIAGLMGGFFLFSGYFIAKNSIPVYWIWVYYLSIFKYPLEALLVNEYSSDPTIVYGIMDGQSVLATWGLDQTNKWVQVGALFAFALAYRLLCYGALLVHGTTRH